MPKYNNPPIIESVCEIRFSDDTNWDITVPGLIFEDIRNEYPQKEQRTTQEINISMSGIAFPRTRSQIKRQDYAVFLTDDKKSRIQVGPRILLINQLKPYSAWNDFKSQVNYAFQKLSVRVELAGVQRIGLRYINKIEIPMENNKVTLEEYFEFRPFCGERLPQTHGEFIVGCVFPYSGGRDLCRIEFTSAMPENEGSLAFLLSLDYFLAKPRSIPVTQSIDWIEEAHGNIENLFEGCILPPLREIFGEVKE
jgi:uncharacterized protein (TIGR04255 family)